MLFHSTHNPINWVLIMITLLCHLLSPKSWNLLPEINLCSLVWPIILSDRVFLKFFNKRPFVLDSCASWAHPILSTTCPVRRPQRLLSVWNWVSEVPMSCMCFTRFMVIWFFLEGFSTAPVNTSSRFWIIFLLLFFKFSKFISCHWLSKLLLLDFFRIFRWIIFNFSKHSTIFSINFHLSI